MTSNTQYITFFRIGADRSVGFDDHNKLVSVPTFKIGHVTQADLTADGHVITSVPSNDLRHYDDGGQPVVDEFSRELFTWMKGKEHGA